MRTYALEGRSREVLRTARPFAKRDLGNILIKSKNSKDAKTGNFCPAAAATFGGGTHARIFRASCAAGVIYVDALTFSESPIAAPARWCIRLACQSTRLPFPAVPPYPPKPCKVPPRRHVPSATARALRRLTGSSSSSLINAGMKSNVVC